MPVIRRRVLISGVVQGVWFRAYTKEAAQDADVTGWVRNLHDGRVEAVFEGEEENVQQAVDWCYQGSPGSRVKNVVVMDEPPSGEFNDFRITYSTEGY